MSITEPPHIIILGAGPAGLGAAFQLTRKKKARVTVLELRNSVGGNSGSFEYDGLYLDYGSHRLHPACDPALLADIKQLLGDDLLVRPRHGRILLKKRWIHFPLNLVDLMTRLPVNFGLGVAADTVRKMLPGRRADGNGQSTFASVLREQLGNTICQEFYFPYARKIWGLEPEEISEIQAQKRVSANSIGKIIKKVFSKPSHEQGNGKPIFYYPRQGFGQISHAFYQAAVRQGANFELQAKVVGIEHQKSRLTNIIYENDGGQHTISGDYVWSTLPLTILTRAMQPSPPEEVIAASQGIEYRSMLLIYLILEQDQFTEYDAHYFPGEEIPITRLSEPKNYSDSREPRGLTALCAELPCNATDSVWQMDDDELGQLVLNALSTAGIPVSAPVRQVFVKRLRFAYPIFEKGYEKHFSVLDDFAARFNNLLTFGRQGLFVHDNTHHALYMAYAAVDCLTEDGTFDTAKWEEYRAVFQTHVVED